MSDKNSIIDQVKNILSTELDGQISESDIGNEISLFEDGLGLDSVNLVELIALVEKRFEIQFEDDELNPELFATVNTIAEAVLSKK